ncbi:MAG: Nif3-like dinuclear metal center hexameric protein [Clostridiales Family XIII bacterium]|jgi:dinuclear metal center YbgI/SA1388 family protein|nr:Nif3-like dinuclear metal center hexameric protein [Clostridiales Family XIII bacterium]
MTLSTDRLIHSIEEKYPPALQEEYDNCGWQIDLRRDDTESVLVALEVTGRVIDEAKELGVGLILTHHPLVFMPLRRIDTGAGDPVGEYVVRLINAGIGVYSAHTSFDAAEDGMNDALARAFGLSDVKGFPLRGSGASSIGRSGMLEPPLPFGEVIARAEQHFGMRGRLKTIGDPARMIRKVALCGGGAGEYVLSAVQEGMDLYITADLRHHEAQFARERGLALIDGGHWGTEKIFVSVMCGFLQHAFGDSLRIIASQVSADPYLPWGEDD